MNNSSNKERMSQPTKTVRKEGSTTSTGSSKRLPLGAPAFTATDVFISTKNTQAELEKLVAKNSFVFVRAGVAAGKTTVVENWRTPGNTDFVVIPSPIDGDPAQFLTNIVRAINKNSAAGAGISRNDLHESATAAVAKARDEGTLLIFDEAHLLFGSSDLVNCLIKDNYGAGLKPRVLMVSTVSEIEASAPVKTPPGIAKFMWHPRPPQVSSLRSELQQAGVLLDEPSINFFVQLCGNHRGILMCCFDWVAKKQDANEEWDIGKTITNVRGDFGADHDVWCGQGDSLAKTILGCRAVKVNGRFSHLPAVPLEFVKMLCEGPKVLPEDVRRTLTIHGFVLPMLPSTQSNDEFVRYDWTDPAAKSAVSNPLLAWYYRHHLEMHHHLTTSLAQPPMSCVDLLLTALPKMSFMYVVSRGGVIGEVQQPGTSMAHLPYELNYTSAIITALKSMHVDAQSLDDDAKKGIVDVYVRQRSSTSNNITTFAMEGIMASRSQSGADATTHDAHRRRFDKESTYYANATNKCLFTIGAVKEDVYDRVACTKADGVTIVGIVAAAHHTRYQIFIKDASVKVVEDQEWAKKNGKYATHSGIVGPLTVECDHVAMRYEAKEQKLVSNQLFRSIANIGVWAGTIWVRQKQSEGAATPAAFKVVPAENTVDSLKDAIKMKWEANKETKLDALGLEIFGWDTASNAPTKQALESDLPLRSNTAATPYTF